MILRSFLRQNSTFRREHNEVGEKRREKKNKFGLEWEIECRHQFTMKNKVPNKTYGKTAWMIKWYHLVVSQSITPSDCNLDQF